MSERSIYLRDQITKCEFHAKSIGDTETQGELRKLAAQYLAEALEIERVETAPRYFFDVFDITDRLDQLGQILPTMMLLGAKAPKWRRTFSAI
jgi:hypothetical protein